MIDALIICHNEAINLPHCLKALTGWTHRIFVIDSGSTDGTIIIAQSMGAEVIHHDWEGYARQKNWALNNLPLEADWILIVDADEVITSELQRKLTKITDGPAGLIPENGFFINRLTYFTGKPIRHCGYFPNWNMRFFKRGRGYYEDRAVHEHMIIDHPVGYIREYMLHEDRRGLEHYIAKHNRYSTLEARTLFHEITSHQKTIKSVNLPSDTFRRRWLKRYMMPYLPFPGLWRFLYMYIIRLGVLDGSTGFRFCTFISMYDSMVVAKLRELLRLYRAGQIDMADKSKDYSGLAQPEGYVEGSGSSSDIEHVESRSKQVLLQTQPEPSPWTFKEKLYRAIWMIIGRPVFRMSFHNWYGFRAAMLRLFGAKIGKGVALRPTVQIEVPWMLEIDDDVSVGDYAILYSLGRTYLGKRSIVSQYSHLCAGTHDYTDHTFKLIRAPITIGNDVWIGADVFIGPGVTVGSLTVVGARSSVYKDLPPKQVCVGNPAKPVKERELR